MTLLLRIAVLLALGECALAQVQIIAWNPVSTNLSSVLPYIDGVTIPVGWSSTDMTTCGTSPPCTYNFSFSSLNSSLSPYVSPVVCGRSLPGRSGGHPCIINIVAQPASDPMINSDTPSYIFSSTWETQSHATAPQDAVFCPSYPGTSFMGVSPPSPTGYANIGTSNCTNSIGSTSCTAGALATGLPAPWETPFVAAVTNWWSNLIPWVSGNGTTNAALSQIGYVRFGFSQGGEASLNCTPYLESALGSGGDAALKTAWLNAYANAASYIGGQWSSQPPVTGSHWVPMMTFNMGTGLTSPTTDPSWSIAEVQAILANQPFAIGSQGLQNGKVMGTIFSDLTAIQNGPTCTGLSTDPCCSDNWCNTRSMVIGQVPYIELQDCNLSDPGGGNKHCLDSSLAGTSTNDALTLSQVFILSSQHGTTSAEIYYQDLECAVGAIPLICPSGPNTTQSDYLAALLALSSGQPSGSSALAGNAQLIGNATMF